MYKLCLLLVCKISLFILSLVVVTPTGPLYIAINTSRTIYSSVPDGGLLIDWIVEFRNNYLSLAYVVPGFMFIKNETSSTLTINTMDTSITKCIALLDIPPRPLLQKHIALTIYGMLIL